MTFSSVYEILTPLTTVRKTKFWDWFDGDDLRSWWTKRDRAGTGTFAMADAVGEGFSIQSGAVANDISQIDFNDIRHYSNTVSIVQAIIRALSTASQFAVVGFVNPATAVNINFSEVGTNTGQDATNFSITTADATTVSATGSDLALDTIFRLHKIEMTSTSNIYSIDGVIKVTKITNLPTNKLQPFFMVVTSVSSAKEGRIRYLEAYNT